MIRKIFLILILSAVKFTAPAHSTGTFGAFSKRIDDRKGPFEFYSNFWVNLHHFLYQQAQPGSDWNPALNNSLTPEDSKNWGTAVEFYRKNIIQHNLIFDDQMIMIDSVLANNNSEKRLINVVGIGDVLSILNKVAPIYRTQWWPKHNKANCLWISTAEPLFQAFGSQLHEQLAIAYGTEWYPGTIHVDVSIYTGPRLVAYTTGTKHGHAVISSTNSRGQGLDVLEILFHEAAHTIVHQNNGIISETIALVAKKDGIPEPIDLWHALMFYTTGELVRREFANLGISYQPYAEKNELWIGNWSNYQGVLSVFWRQHLDGKLTIKEAITKMVDALSLDYIGNKHN